MLTNCCKKQSGFSQGMHLQDVCIQYATIIIGREVGSALKYSYGLSKAIIMAKAQGETAFGGESALKCSYSLFKAIILAKAKGKLLWGGETPNP